MNIIKKIKVCVFLCLLMGAHSSFANKPCSDVMRHDQTLSFAMIHKDSFAVEKILKYKGLRAEEINQALVNAAKSDETFHREFNILTITKDPRVTEEGLIEALVAAVSRNNLEFAKTISYKLTTAALKKAVSEVPISKKSTVGFDWLIRLRSEREYEERFRSK